MRKLKLQKPDFREYWNLMLANSRATAVMVAAFIVTCGLMLWHLASLTPGLSKAEINTYESASNLTAIADNMVNAPYKLAVFVSTSISESAFGLRLTGALMGILSIIIFHLLARRLFNGYIAVVSTAMYATNSLLLSAARQATPNVMLLSLLALIGVGFYLRFGKRQDIAWILTAAVIGLTLYVPGMVIFIVLAAAWQFRHVRKSFEHLRNPILITTSVIFGALLTPLIVNLIREPHLWRAYLGFPDTFAPLIEMVKYAGTAVLSLFLRSAGEPSYWLGRQPILDIFASVMLVYGLWVLIKQHRLDRLWTIGGVFLLTLLWIGATTNRLGIVMLIPFVYIVVGIGIQNFINRWLKVFPRNPIARWVGSALLLIAILLSVNFQSYRYFVAWPNADQTKAVFDRTLDARD